MGKWKALQTDGKLALYDLSEDLGETQDLVSQNPSLANRINRIIEELE